jgi:hypothetical protein
MLNKHFTELSEPDSQRVVTLPAFHIYRRPIVIDFVYSTVLFHTLAALTLFAVTAIEACRPAPRATRVQFTAAPSPIALARPDASNQDFAESYDEAA